MALQINPAGVVTHPRIRNARSALIERGALSSVSGIVVHQTDSSSAAATLNSYKNAGANGAHFLIDLDGTIYQTASVYQRANHVGKLKARCIADLSCTAASYPAKLSDAQAVNKVELSKARPLRYPTNSESIGIELVGRAKLPDGFVVPAHAKTWSADRVRGEFGVYPTPTPLQNQSLKWLMEELTQTMQVDRKEIFRHPTVSWKNMTEAKGAEW